MTNILDFCLPSYRQASTGLIRQEANAMLRAWVAGVSTGPPTRLQSARNLSPDIDQRATMLETQADAEWRAATRALATGDWTTAANWEERRVITEDALAQLLIEC